MAIDVNKWSALVKAFRTRPGSARYAAEQAGVTRPTAKRAWEVGWPEDTPPKPAVRAMFEQEAAEAQAKATAVKAEAEAFAASLRQEARSDALDVHDQEGRVVKAARVNATNLLSVAARLPPALAKVAERVAIQLAQAELPPDKALETLARAATVIERAVKVGQLVLEMERLYRGDPTKIVGVVPVEEMSVEEARRLALEAYEAAQRYERHGLEVIDGGAESGPVVPVQAAR